MSHDETHDQAPYTTFTTETSPKLQISTSLYDDLVATAETEVKAGDYYIDTSDTSGTYYTTTTIPFQPGMKYETWTTGSFDTWTDPWPGTTIEEDLPLEMLDKMDELDETMATLREKALKNPDLFDSLERLALEEEV